MQEISTEAAPEALGPYSQGIKDGDTVYVSGQAPLDPSSGEIVGDDAAEQTARTLENVASILEAGGTSLDNVVKTTVFLADIDDYNTVNEVYSDYMSEPYPARSAVQVADLPIEIDVEIEVIATV